MIVHTLRTCQLMQTLKPFVLAHKPAYAQVAQLTPPAQTHQPICFHRSPSSQHSMLC